MNELCAELRTCAVSLVDSFNFSDHIINSPLGVSSGDVYKVRFLAVDYHRAYRQLIELFLMTQVYFDRVRASNPHESVHPYFDRLIKPLLEREALELDDAESMDLDEEINEIRTEREEAAAENAANAAAK